MSDHMSAAEYQRLIAKPAVALTQREYSRLMSHNAAISIVKQPRRGRMNKSEQAYVRECIEPCVLSGLIVWWAFEPISIRLVASSDGDKGLWYVPDFWIIYEEGQHYFCEIKGYQRRADIQSRSGIDRWKMASEKFPWALWTMVGKGKNGWETLRMRRPEEKK